VKLSQRRLARPSLGGLLATRHGSLMLALICAVCAAGILVFALGRYKTSLRTPVTQASVLVATSEIPKGTSGQDIASQRLYKLEPVSASQVTPGALSDAATIANETAATSILPGQQLTAADFAGVTELAQTLAPNQRAVEVPIQEAPGATDIVQAGDHVDVYTQMPKISTASSGSGSLTAPLLTDVLVLKVGTALPAKRDGVSIPGADMVLQLSTDQVDPLIAAVIASRPLYLSLRPANAATTPGTANAAAALIATSKALNTLSTTPNLSSTP
jgi:Flp pilus assembly protein CpaB